MRPRIKAIDNALGTEDVGRLLDLCDRGEVRPRRRGIRNDIAIAN